MTPSEKACPSLAHAVTDALEETRHLPVGARVTDAAFGKRTDGSGWWWYVSAEQFHRLGNGKNQPERDETEANLRAVVERSLAAVTDEVAPVA